MECIREDESFSQHVSSLKSCSTDFPTFYRFLWSPENAGKSEDPERQRQLQKERLKLMPKIKEFALNMAIAGA